MNTNKANQDTTAENSIGARLRAAREQMGLTQQNIAERLCLKLSTVRDIEEDNSPTDLALIFLRGYIRSYARLVQLQEDDLMLMLAKHDPISTAKIYTMQRLSLDKQRKRYDSWLMIFTWLVIFVVISLAGAWWWQNYKITRLDMMSLSSDDVDSQAQASAALPIESHAPLTDDYTDNVSKSAAAINSATLNVVDVAIAIG